MGQNEPLITLNLGLGFRVGLGLGLGLAKAHTWPCKLQGVCEMKMAFRNNGLVGIA